MKTLWKFTLAGMLCAASAWGQEDAAAQVSGVEQERQRIDSVRQQKTAELDAQEAACLSKFAVTDCQNKVSVRRRQMLADLKRQEARLNDLQRRQKAAEQVQRTQDKAKESAQRQAELQSAPPGETQADRQKMQDEKVWNHQQQAIQGQGKASGPKTASGPDAATAEKNRAAYLEKQKAAEKRRRDREQKLLDHAKDGPPLPVAP